MRILFDHGTPSGIARALSGHDVTEAVDRGWEELSNGELLAAAEEEGFDLLLTTDKNIRYQQNLPRGRLALSCSETQLGGWCVCTLTGLRR
jgi:hypothetical protein